MSVHKIIGSEQAGAHVVIRHAAPRRRSAHWWFRTVIELVVCIAFVGMVVGALT